MNNADCARWLANNPADRDAAIAALIDFGRQALAAGLLTSTCGNASVRVGQDMLAITASGAALGGCTHRDVLIVALKTGAVVYGTGKPSMELDLHRHACLRRPSIRAVLHGQSRCATLLACMVDPPRNLDFLPEIPAYVRHHALVDWALPGSPALAESVTAALADPDVTVVQLRNHGQVTIGATPAEVLRRASFFELAAFMATSGAPLTTIPAADAQALREYGRPK